MDVLAALVLIVITMAPLITELLCDWDAQRRPPVKPRGSNARRRADRINEIAYDAERRMGEEAVKYLDYGGEEAKPLG